MKPETGPIAELLLGESDSWFNSYAALTPNSPHDPDAAKLVRGLVLWLARCGAAGQFLPPGSPQRRAMRALLDEWNSRLRRDDHLSQGADRLAEFDPAAGVPLNVDCPYPGLDAYRENRAGGFFGRAALVEDYTKKLIDNHVLMIVGGSGSGKSSVAMAGIRFKICGGEKRPEEFRDWRVPQVFMPGSSPMRALALAMAQDSAGAEADASALLHKLQEGTEAAYAELKTRCGGQSLMLVVDQFEELLTLCRDSSERRAFAGLLARLADKEKGGWPCHVLLTMRTDYLGRFEKSDELKSLYALVIDGKNFEHLPTLNFDSIRRAIAEPANAVGLRFVPAEIPDRLASETAGLANGLPLLQFALHRLWATRPREGGQLHGQPLDLITQKQLDDLPNVQKALGNTANGIYQSLTPNQQIICERVVQELVVLDENFDEPLRRRRRHAELRDVLGRCFPEAEADIVLVEQKFVAAGLFRLFGEANEQQIEVTHEALLRHWEVTRQVVSGDEAKRRLQAIRQIGREAMEWQAAGRKDDLLKQHGQPLTMALEYAKGGWFADEESNLYLAACDARQRTQRSRTFRTRLAVSMTLCLVVGAAAALFIQSAATRANLASLASLSSRLPAWDALDLTYTLAKRGGPDFRFVLGQAVERMEGTWRLWTPAVVAGEDTDNSVYPTQNATALLLFDRSPRTPQVLVHPLRADGSPEKTPFAIPLSADGQIDRLVQVQIGANLAAGAKAAREHWAILVTRRKDGPGFEIASWMLSGDKARLNATPTGAALSLLKGSSNVSTVSMHPDGQRAAFTTVDYEALTSKVLELKLGPKSTSSAEARSVNLADRSDLTTADEDLRCDRAAKDCPSARTVVAVAYAGNDQLVNGRLNGRVYCNARKVLDPVLVSDRSDRLDRSPVAHIAAGPNGAEFAFSNVSGAVFAASCAQGKEQEAYRFEFDGNPASLKWTELSTFKDKNPLVSFLDTDKQLRCYLKKPKEQIPWSWYLCNAAHRLTAAVILPDGMQTSVDQSAVGLARSFPVEGRPLATDRELRAAAAGQTVIRWLVGKSIAIEDRSLNGGTATPWIADEQGNQLEVDSKKRRVEWASLSADGTRIAWIELRRTTDNQDLLLKRIDRPGLQQTVRIVRTMNVNGTNADIPKQEGRALAAAVSNSGVVAQLQAAATPGAPPVLLLGQTSHTLPVLIGEPACLAFSDNGNYVVVGTKAGLLYRLDTQGGSSKMPLVPLVPADAKKNDPGSYPSVTACAVSDQGEVFAGYLDGMVWMFDIQARPLELTQRAVHRFTAPIKQISLAAQRRLAVLGDWQINNCSSAGLPGQTLRAWDLSMPPAQRLQPVADTCFPNEVIAGLGAWSDLSGGTLGLDPCDSTDSTMATQDQVRICLMRPRTARWHDCPACSTGKRSSATQVHEHVLKLAIDKGARPLTNEYLERLYGIKLSTDR